MTTILKNIKAAVLAASLAGLGFAGTANAEAANTRTKLLSAHFAPRKVVQVEVGDFHFKPGQVAPLHTHDAPAVGYVAKGGIIYQVEGEKPQVLREGDAFYEPTGKRILRFDNVSATEEAIFLDFNLEQKGEPFIVFEEKPKQAIDRRTLPTVKLASQIVDQVDIYASELARGSTLQLNAHVPALGLVSEGVVELRVNGKQTKRIVAGASFALPIAGSQATIVNASAEVPAKLVTFQLIARGNLTN
ncbi:MAG: cupin domain-containing protein [Rhodospirillaceae bacterium]|nr:cupin domain-containing protein [Rhodospirillaceae bacterium]MBT7512372.1 cupin domain-containing protein [Rhodospirillaceae bacterium]